MKLYNEPFLTLTFTVLRCGAIVRITIMLFLFLCRLVISRVFHLPLFFFFYSCLPSNTLIRVPQFLHSLVFLYLPLITVNCSSFHCCLFPCLSSYIIQGFQSHVFSVPFLFIHLSLFSLNNTIPPLRTFDYSSIQCSHYKQSFTFFLVDFFFLNGF